MQFFEQNSCGLASKLRETENELNNANDKIKVYMVVIIYLIQDVADR